MMSYLANSSYEMVSFRPYFSRRILNSALSSLDRSSYPAKDLSIHKDAEVWSDKSFPSEAACNSAEINQKLH